MFNKNVLEIKKLIKNIGDLTPLVKKEQKIFVLYDNSNIITNTFFTEVKKKQCYGFVSLQYNYNNKKLINSKNRLPFKILYNTKKEFITLQLEDILLPKKIETED